MRVLSIGSMYPPHDLGGGYELTWRASVTHLRGRGHEVRVLASDYLSPALDPHDELDGDVHRELRWYWRDHAFPRHSPPARVRIERHNANILQRHLAEFEPDVVAWWQMGGMSLALIERVRRLGLPAVGVIGDEWLRWGPRADAWLKPFLRRPRLAGLAERLTRLPARVDLDAAATWLFNSEVMLEKSKHEGLRLPRAQIAHPGIDTQLFRPAPSRDWEWRMLYVGRLDPRKGIDLAVDALPLLPRQARFVIQGGGGATSYVESLRARARAHGVAEQVEFSRVPRDDLPALVADADVLVFPVQWDEPWGLVPLEAMAVGRPVVATGAGGSREYLDHERNCLLFSPREDPAALAAAVQRLADDESLRDTLRENGFGTAARYTEDTYNEAIERALETAAQSREKL